MAELRFDGKVAIVTGAGNGIGRAHALLLGSRGAKVVVNDLGVGLDGSGGSGRPADLVVEEIRNGGGEAVANYDSVTDGDKVVQTAIDTWGRIDIVVNNAGILRDVSFAKMTDAQWDLVYDVHCLGTKRMCKAAWPYMREQRYGRIINTTSVNGLFGAVGQANYSFAKAGIIGFTYTLAQEGSRRNIHVNAIAPQAGSRMTKTVAPGAWVDAMKPEYVSPVVAYLAHEDTKDNGVVLEVGGGWYSKVRWQQSDGYMFDKLATEAFTPEVVRDNWAAAGDYSKDAVYPNWDFKDGQKHSASKHTVNLMKQGLMKMPPPPKAKL